MPNSLLTLIFQLPGKSPTYFFSDKIATSVALSKRKPLNASKRPASASTPLGLIWAPGPRTEDSAVDYNIISNLRFDVHHWAHPQKRPGAWEQPGNIWERLTRGPLAMTMDG